MPSRNRIKEYLDNGHYHLYNRGTEKRQIFQDRQDYSVFLSYLKEYLLPKDEKELLNQLSQPNLPWPEKNKILKLLRLNNFASEITVLAYCLMPNHFHFLIKQNDKGSIDKFMNSLGTRYTMYFNKKYKRVGSLYQGVYKAVLVGKDEQLLHLTRYIHKQSNNQVSGSFVEKHPNSLSAYLKHQKFEWLKPDEILSYFSETKPHFSYKSFLLSRDEETNTVYTTNDLLIEDSHE